MKRGKNFNFMSGDLIRTRTNHRDGDIYNSLGVFICQLIKDKNQYNDMCLVLIGGSARKTYNCDWQYV